jgi:hypothetical protein
MNDKLTISIRIANQAPVSLAINPADEEVIRKAEFHVNRLWKSWSTKFKNRSATEVLAMVAFRFAELYFTQEEVLKNTNEAISTFESSLDRILLDMGEE